jgi:hypothetical protein
MTQLAQLFLNQLINYAFNHLDAINTLLFYA